MNIRQLSLVLGMDYKSVQAHIELLVENGILETPTKKYGSLYFLSHEWDDNNYLQDIMRGDGNEKKKRRK